MAIDNQFGKGIGVAAGFDLGAQKPLDARIAVNTIAERDAHVENNRAYEGMIVFVDETKKNYQLINGVWQELAKAEQDRLDALEAMLNGEGEGVEGGALAALQANINKVQENLDKEAETARDAEKAIADELAKQKDAEQEGTLANQIKVERERAEAAEEDLQKAIDAINNAENGILAQAKALDKEDRDAQALVDAEQDRRLTALEDANKEGGAVKEAIDKVAQDLADFEGEQATAHEALTKKDDALQAAIDAINNAETGILAQAKALDKIDRDAQSEFDAAQNNRITALENANKEGGEVANAIKAVQDNLDNFIDAQETAHEALTQKDADLQKAIEDEVARVDRIVGEYSVEADENGEGAVAASGLKGDIEAERKAREAAIDDLAKRHDEEMEAVEDRVADLEALHDGENSVENQIAKAKKDMQDALDAAVQAQAAVDKAQDEALKKAQDDLGLELEGLQGDIDQEVADRKSAFSELDIAIKDEAAKREEEDGKLADAIEDEIARVDEIVGNYSVEADENGEGAVAATGLRKDIEDERIAREAADKTEKEAREKLDERVQAIEESIGDGGNLEARVQANEDAIEIINGEGEGSIKKAVADLVDGAPEALDTLNELAAALRDNADVLTAIETAFDGKLATLQADVDQNEADCDKAIADEKARAEEQEGLIRDELADEKAALQKEIADAVKVVADELANQKNAELEGSLANQIKVEKARAEEQEGLIRDELADEAARVDEIVGNYSVEADEENGVEAQPATGLRKDIEDEIKARISAIKALQNSLNVHLTTAAYDNDQDHTDLAPLA